MSNSYKEKNLRTNKFSDDEKDDMFPKKRLYHELEVKSSDRLYEKSFVQRFAFGLSTGERKTIRKKDRIATKHVLRKSIADNTKPPSLSEDIMELLNDSQNDHFVKICLKNDNLDVDSK